MRASALAAPPAPSKPRLLSDQRRSHPTPVTPSVCRSGPGKEGLPGKWLRTVWPQLRGGLEQRRRAAAPESRAEPWLLSVLLPFSHRRDEQPEPSDGVISRGWPPLGGGGAEHSPLWLAWLACLVPGRGL